MTSFAELFWVFFKVGTFTIGGGYAMIPLMQKLIVEKKQWLSQEEFLDTIALSQAMPGLFAANMATNVGYRLRGKTGAVVSVIGNILVPILIILAIAIFFRQFRENKVVESIFMGIRPAVVALIAAPVFTMAKSSGIRWQNCWIPIVSALLIWMFGVSPILIIIAAGVGGFIFSKIKERKEPCK